MKPILSALACFAALLPVPVAVTPAFDFLAVAYHDVYFLHIAVAVVPPSQRIYTMFSTTVNKDSPLKNPLTRPAGFMLLTTSANSI